MAKRLVESVSLIVYVFLRVDGGKLASLASERVDLGYESYEFRGPLVCFRISAGTTNYL